MVYIHNSIQHHGDGSRETWVFLNDTRNFSVFDELFVFPFQENRL